MKGVKVSSLVLIFAILWEFIAAVSEAKNLDLVPILWPVGPGTNRISCPKFQKLLSDLQNEYDLQYLRWFKCIENCESEHDHVWQQIATMDNKGRIYYEKGMDAPYTLSPDAVLEIRGVTVADNNSEFRCSIDVRTWGLKSDHILTRYYEEKQENINTCTCPAETYNLTCPVTNTTTGSGENSTCAVNGTKTSDGISCVVWSTLASLITCICTVFVCWMIFPHIHQRCCTYLLTCCRTHFQNIVGLFSSQTERPTDELQVNIGNAVIDGAVSDEDCNQERKVDNNGQNNYVGFSIEQNTKYNENIVPGNGGIQL